MEKKSIDDSSSKICTFLYVTKRKGFKKFDLKNVYCKNLSIIILGNSLLLCGSYYKYVIIRCYNLAHIFPPKLLKFPGTRKAPLTPMRMSTQPLSKPNRDYV